MSKTKLPVVSIILYVLAGVLLIFAIWSAVYSFNYISDMVASGQLVPEGNLFEIISFHMTNFAQYVVFSAVLFSLGWILQIVATTREENLANGSEDLSSAEEPSEDFEDELFDEDEDQE